MNLYVITPVLNEAENLENLLNGWIEIENHLENYTCKFILVDDGSSDGTEEKAMRLRGKLDLKVLRHDINKGPGFAFGTGFEYLADKLNKRDIVVTMEGDNTSRIETLKIMVGRMEREEVDVALASPYAYNGGIQNTSFIRMLLSHFGNGLTKVALNVRGIHTLSSFFRAHRGHVILDLQAKYGNRIVEFPGFESMLELIKKLTLQKISITEVPMNLDTSLRKGKSKMKIMKTIRGYFKVYLIARKY